MVSHSLFAKIQRGSVKTKELTKNKEQKKKKHFCRVIKDECSVHIIKITVFDYDHCFSTAKKRRKKCLIMKAIHTCLSKVKQVVQK